MLHRLARAASATLFLLLSLTSTAFAQIDTGVIVGRVDNLDGTPNAGGAVAFAISINNAGEATVAQYLSLDHPTSPDNYDEPLNLAGKLNADTVADGGADPTYQAYLIEGDDDADADIDVGFLVKTSRVG